MKVVASFFIAGFMLASCNKSSNDHAAAEDPATNDPVIVATAAFNEVALGTWATECVNTDNRGAGKSVKGIYQFLGNGQMFKGSRNYSDRNCAGTAELSVTSFSYTVSKFNHGYGQLLLKYIDGWVQYVPFIIDTYTFHEFFPVEGNGHTDSSSVEYKREN
jgi:hypothetical protein